MEKNARSRRFGPARRALRQLHSNPLPSQTHGSPHSPSGTDPGSYPLTARIRQQPARSTGLYCPSRTISPACSGASRKCGFRSPSGMISAVDSGPCAHAARLMMQTAAKTPRRTGSNRDRERKKSKGQITTSSVDHRPRACNPDLPVDSPSSPVKPPAEKDAHTETPLLRQHGSQCVSADSSTRGK